MPCNVHAVLAVVVLAAASVTGQPPGCGIIRGDAPGIEDDPIVFNFTKLVRISSPAFPCSIFLSLCIE